MFGLIGSLGPWNCAHTAVVLIICPKLQLTESMGKAIKGFRKAQEEDLSNWRVKHHSRFAITLIIYLSSCPILHILQVSYCYPASVGIKNAPINIRTVLLTLYNETRTMRSNTPGPRFLPTISRFSTSCCLPPA